jgi:hypothetical protein
MKRESEVNVVRYAKERSKGTRDGKDEVTYSKGQQGMGMNAGKQYIDPS